MKFQLFALAVVLLVCMTNAKPGVGVDLTPIIQAGIDKMDQGLSCNKYDGLGVGCWNEDYERRDKVCENCMDNRFSYKPWFIGRCYCCKYC